MVQGKANLSFIIFFVFQGKVPLLSLHALEQVHIFIFVLAITQVVLSVATVLLGLLQVSSFYHNNSSSSHDFF
jgi:hypothetical protein